MRRNRSRSNSATRVADSGLDLICCDPHMGPASPRAFEQLCENLAVPFLYPGIDRAIPFSSIAMLSHHDRDKNAWLLRLSPASSRPLPLYAPDRARARARCRGATRRQEFRLGGAIQEERPRSAHRLRCPRGTRGAGDRTHLREGRLDGMTTVGRLSGSTRDDRRMSAGRSRGSRWIGVASRGGRRSPRSASGA